MTRMREPLEGATRPETRALVKLFEAAGYVNIADAFESAPVNASTYHRWNDGGDIKLSKLRALAEYWGSNIETLLRMIAAEIDFIPEGLCTIEAALQQDKTLTTQEVAAIRHMLTIRPGGSARVAEEG